MNRKYLKTLALCFCLSTIAHSQTANNIDNTKNKTPLKVGVKVGYSLGKLESTTDNIYDKDYESISGIDFGLTFEFKLSDMISMQPEINYTQRGGKRTGLQPVAGNELSEQLNMFFPFIGLPPITNENPLYATYESESDLQYIEVPALVKFSWGNNFRVSAAIGPYVGILIKATQHTTGESQFFLDAEGTNAVFVPGADGLPPFVVLPAQSLDADTNVKDNLRTVNFGGIVALGASKKINNKSELFIDARGTFSFSPIQLNDDFGSSIIGGVIFSLGYAYDIQ